jgi:hypothetical protein
LESESIPTLIRYNRAMRVPALLVGALICAPLIAPACSDRKDARDHEIILPVRWCGNAAIVDVMINGKGPYALLLDTGCSPPAVLSERVAADLAGDVKFGLTRMESASGKEVSTDRVLQVRQLSVGKEELVGGSAPISDMTSFQRDLHTPLDGILGFAAFADVILILDYPGQQVRIDHGTLAASDQCSAMSTWSGQVPALNSRVGDRDLAIAIDSGSNGGLHLNAAQWLPISGDWRAVGTYSAADGRHRHSAARLKGEVRLGAVTVLDPIIDDSGGPSSIGTAILRRFVWSLDQRAGLMKVAGSGPMTFRPGPLHGIGMGDMPSADVTTVTEITPDGPAAAAGLHVGDVIMEVNDIPFSSLDCGEWNRLVAGAAEMKFLVRRGSQKDELRVKVAELVP